MASAVQGMRLVQNLGILAVTNNNLVSFKNRCPSEGDIIAENVRSEPFTACSISEVIQMRYVFLVGGVTGDGKLPSPDVFFLDLLDFFGGKPINRTPGPPLIAPKWRPTLIVMGSKLFAISHILCDPNPDSIWKSHPAYEVLDTSYHPWQWRTGQSFPELPRASDDGDSYHLVSYAADEGRHTLYLCLGDGTIPYTQGTHCIAYDAGLDKWITGAYEPLPFDREGKVFGNFFYGFPCGATARNCSHLGVYQLDSPKLNSISCWVMLRKYSLFPNISKPFRAYFPYLCVLREDVVAIMRGRTPSSFQHNEPHLLDFAMVKLLKMREKDKDGDIEAPIEMSNFGIFGTHTEEFDAIVGVFSDRVFPS